MGNEEFQGRKVFEQIRGEALHERSGVSIQIVGAGGVKTVVATGAHMNHGGNVVFHHFFVNGVPLFVAQGRRCPVTARGIWVEIDTDIAVLLDATL